MEIRLEEEQDWPCVYALNAAAFDTDAEAKLVNALRERASPVISMFASIDDAVVGHIMFTPVEPAQNTEAFIMGLAPMAVAEKFRGKGIGSELVISGIDACRKLGAGAIVVLGHFDYYPRFGFEAASKFDITCEYDVPDDAFMALELIPEYLAPISGVIKYHELFTGV